MDATAIGGCGASPASTYNLDTIATTYPRYFETGETAGEKHPFDITLYMSFIATIHHLIEKEPDARASLFTRVNNLLEWDSNYLATLAATGQGVAAKILHPSPGVIPAKSDWTVPIEAHTAFNRELERKAAERKAAREAERVAEKASGTPSAKVPAADGGPKLMELEEGEITG